MECNKEEAIRAKEIAENKMHNRDFFAARKIVLKAQQLFPDLDNVSQMLTVCDVHCAAVTKVNGEIDWYGILQVGPTADDSVIRKQYRKLALLLHPDKNKFGGAEAAFKLVGEAHRTLSDRDKRALHDMKSGAGFRTASMRPAQQPNKTPFTKKQTAPTKNSISTKFGGINQPQAPSVSSTQTFWTICPFCGIRYQYYQTIMNRALRCQSCMKPFIAYDLNAQPAPSAAAWNRTGNPQSEKPCPSPAGMSSQTNVDKASTASEPSTGARMYTEFVTGSSKNTKEDGKMEKDSGAGNDKFEKVKLQEVKKREQAAKPSAGHGSQKRGRKLTVETGDSDSSDGDVMIEDGYPVGKAASAGTTTRRSTRQKQNVSYKENQDGGDDFVSPVSKKLKEGIPTNAQERDGGFDDGKANGIKVQTDAAFPLNKNDERKNKSLFDSFPNGSHGVQHDASKRERDLQANATAEFSSAASSLPDTFSYPDPEFCDFGKERDENKFEADQIWAAYDEFDAMPRYYAWIRQVYSPKFKMKFTWLEYDPVTKDESLWYAEDLPVGCGSYKLGKSEFTEDCLMFSHLMPLKKGTKRNSFQIHPRKNEVWAMFKDWNIGWASQTTDKRHYEYEVVEVISDFTEGDVITAVRLVKIQGFVGLFVKTTENLTASLKLSESDILQFSHKIPSYRLVGNEREGIPKGSLELDCASLPPNFAATYPSISLESIKVRAVDLDNIYSSSLSGAKKELPTCPTNTSSSHSKENGECMEEPNLWSAAGDSGKPAERSDESAPKQQDGKEEKNIHAEDPNSKVDECQIQSQPLPGNPNVFEYADSEFYDFEAGRSAERFERGQIWALYSDIDSYPKYYALVKKVELESFKVCVRWLEGYSDREEDIQWFENRLPVGCGTFRIIQESAEFDSTETFSHMVQAKPITGRRLYVINPIIGEIWAVYKNWSPGWSMSDVETCGFDVVEILSSDSSGFKVSALTKVNGYRFVFMPQKESGSELYIPIADRLRFSHQIPAFKLTEERGGKLRGYVELDPASVPDVLLCSS